MKIAVIGTGYVGLVSGAGLADVGVDVVCVDVDQARLRVLESGTIPFYEPGLDDLVSRNVKAKRLRFSADLAEALLGREVVLLCVGTPQAADGSADLRFVLEAAQQVKDAASGPLVLATKSTVPVGTAARLRALMQGGKHAITVAANPEFLKEGDAVNDFLKPERIILGVDDVRRGMSSDSRIGKAFLYPGVGYGGSCFPKDVKALAHIGRAHGAPQTILEATDAANTRQRGVMLEKIITHFDGSLAGKVIAIWGLAFKPRTDDIREAPAIPLIEGLLAQGALVRAWDRAAVPNARARFGEKHGEQLFFGADEYSVVNGADALVLVTEWPEFRSPDWDDIGRKLKHKVVFDGRNIYDAQQLRERGFVYVGVGRP